MLREKTRGKDIYSLALAACAPGSQTRGLPAGFAGPGTPSCPAIRLSENAAKPKAGWLHNSLQESPASERAEEIPTIQGIWQPSLPNMCPPFQLSITSAGGEGGWVRRLLSRAWGSALLDVPPAPSLLLLSAGSKVEAKAAAVQASALWQLFHSLKAAACCLLQWEALGQAGEKEKGQVPSLTPSRILASPGPSPASEADPKPCHPEKPHLESSAPGHGTSASPGETLRGGRSRAGAGAASPAASGCNQCLQNWLSSFPASSQVSCFPQDPEPVTLCAGVSHAITASCIPGAAPGSQLCPC